MEQDENYVVAYAETFDMAWSAIQKFFEHTGLRYIVRDKRPNSKEFGHRDFPKEVEHTQIVVKYENRKDMDGISVVPNQKIPFLPLYGYMSMQCHLGEDLNESHKKKKAEKRKLGDTDHQNNTSDFFEDLPKFLQ